MPKNERFPFGFPFKRASFYHEKRTPLKGQVSHVDCYPPRPCHAFVHRRLHLSHQQQKQQTCLVGCARDFYDGECSSPGDWASALAQLKRTLRLRNSYLLLKSNDTNEHVLGPTALLTVFEIREGFWPASVSPIPWFQHVSVTAGATKPGRLVPRPQVPVATFHALAMHHEHFPSEAQWPCLAGTFRLLDSAGLKKHARCSFVSRATSILGLGLRAPKAKPLPSLSAYPQKLMLHPSPRALVGSTSTVSSGHRHQIDTTW